MHKRREIALRRRQTTESDNCTPRPEIKSMHLSKETLERKQYNETVATLHLS